MQSAIRRMGFYTLDRLRGGAIQRHIRQISSHLKSDQNEIKDWARTHMFELLDHAKRTVPYYAGLRSADANDLLSFPILTKAQISERFEEFFSTSYKRDSLVPVITGGSYGTPFTFWLTPDKRARQRAEVIFFSRWAGYRVGDRHAYTRVTKRKSPVHLWLQNEILMDPTNITDEWLENQRQALLTDGIRYIIAYPSTLHVLAKHCARHGDSPSKFRLRGIISTAEPLTPEIRESAESTFGCKVLSRYSAQETGVLAHECSEFQLHHLNTASYHFEVLKMHNDAPAEPGELGRIVVTDLYSYAMPLIRYEIGDLGVLSEGPCRCSTPLPVLAQIHGRTVEQVLDTSNGRISPFAINAVFRDLKGIKQFQFIQTAPSQYEVLIIPLRNFDSEQTIRERLLDLLGTKADIRFSKVDEIPPLPSGKRPFILNRVGND